MENTLVAGGLTLIFLGIGSMFGSLGIIVAGVLLVGVGISSGRSDGESANPTKKTNCPSCGARNERENDVCHHCGTVLSGK
ncbi:hypothetical protein A4G99_11740 [Haladaptatus sp. R4]|uniref:zinc ribbon domain-containing protein n=1 Tax=Haladaptatus sp. R4 TaxID=1679489 RepID=UPI0007B4F07C|nr:zinc ribbon domain-containing protein [Haladaptatus sp. R4]KZN23568.1 hypothetical protein A4G99_11740 [Haladaptatus sp. R4]